MNVYFLTNEDEKNYIKSINSVAPDENGNAIVLTGSCPVLAQMAATNTQGKVTVAT